MLKRLLILTILSAILFLCAVPAFALENKDNTLSADTIYFDINTTDWEDFDSVYCHIRSCDGKGNWPSWQSQYEKCTYNKNTGIASYNLSNTGNVIENGANWFCVFSNEKGEQTYNLLMGKECIGDTVYCSGEYYESPSDSRRSTVAAFWKNQDEDKFGPMLAITSIGNIVGNCIPENTSGYRMFVSFLAYSYRDAKLYTDKTDQQLIDYLGRNLGLSAEEIKNGIDHSGAYVKWDPEKARIVKGDADYDNQLTIADATLIQMYLAKIIGDDEIDLESARVSANDLSIYDATRIGQALAHIRDL